VNGEVSLGLAILGVLGSLGGGAAVGAAVNHFLHERTERKQSEREKEALAILIRTEILVNAGSLDFLLDHPHNLLAQEYSPPLTSKTWQDARVRLAQLLPGKDLVVVMTYYTNLQMLLEDLPIMRSSRELVEKDQRAMAFMAQQLGKTLDVIKKSAEEAQARLDEHIPEEMGFERAPTPTRLPDA
jgi:hypothetical protein